MFEYNGVLYNAFGNAVYTSVCSTSSTNPCIDLREAMPYEWANSEWAKRYSHDHKCTHCGRKIRAEDDFCPGCGAPE